MEMKGRMSFVTLRVKLLPRLIGAVLLVACASWGEPTRILPVEALHAGMRGYGLTDLGRGRGIEKFDVEVLGVLRNFAPRQDLILVRVSGDRLDQSGIIAGMSGSPVYIDGKLIGALAYGWPFSKEPIAGVTPIRSMLDIRHVPPGPPTPIGAPGATKAFVDAFGEGRFGAPLEAMMASFHPNTVSGWSALPVPVSFAGARWPAGSVLDRFAEKAGWMSVPGGGSVRPQGPETQERLEPGSSVATILLDGDMTLAATGTVTWVDGNNVLAFGHPFLSMGPVEMPMAGSEVLGVLPSVFRSFKFSTTGDVLGSITQDRSTGILGSFGSRAAMIPLVVRIRSADLPEQTFHFRVVKNSMLTPILSAIAVDNVLTTLEKSAGERTIVWKSAIQTRERTIHWDTVFSGLTANQEAVGSLALLTNYLMANEFHDLDIESITVEMIHSDALSSARVTSVEAGKDRIHPGETVPVRVTLQDFRKGPRDLTIDLPIPVGTPPGPLTVFVGDGAAATAFDLALFPPDPRSLDQVLDFLARIRPANSVNLFVYRKAPGVVLAGQPLPGLPPSVASLVVDKGPGDNTPDLAYTRLFEKTVEQPVPVAGSVRLRLTVLPDLN
jgi:SpoIVB peptidase S55